MRLLGVDREHSTFKAQASVNLPEATSKAATRPIVTVEEPVRNHTGTNVRLVSASYVL